MHALALQFAASLAHEAFQITHGPAEAVLRAARRTGPSIGPRAIMVGDALPPSAFCFGSCRSAFLLLPSTLRSFLPPGRCMERLRHSRQNRFSHSG